MYASDVAQVNDRVTRLVGLLRERGLVVDEDPLHPAVMEAETSVGVVAFARERIAEAAGLVARHGGAPHCGERPARAPLAAQAARLKAG